MGWGWGGTGRQTDSRDASPWAPRGNRVTRCVHARVQKWEGRHHPAPVPVPVPIPTAV